ncbi:hypothetical protein D3C75_1159380 [compost metagenome]
MVPVTARSVCDAARACGAAQISAVVESAAKYFFIFLLISVVVFLTGPRGLLRPVSRRIGLGVTNK